MKASSIPGEALKVQVHLISTFFPGVLLMGAEVYIKYDHIHNNVCIERALAWILN